VPGGGRVGPMRRCLWLLVLALALPAAAQQDMEIIPLRAQTLDSVLPVLLPLVEPGGTLTGMNDQIFLRASRRNRDEIKRVLATIDVPARRLIIRVATRRDAAMASSGADVGGQVVIGSDSRARVDARLWDTQGTRGESAGQMVQTVEGGQAYINVGRSLPVPMRQVVVGPGGAIAASGTVVYHDIGSGFYASPRLNGDRVTIAISQQAERAGYGGIDSQRLTTTVSGRLGEWIELGGGSRQATGSQGVIAGYGGGSSMESGSVWLRVEEVR